MFVIRCACALLVTPYKSRSVNNWLNAADKCILICSRTGSVYDPGMTIGFPQPK